MFNYERLVYQATLHPHPVARSLHYIRRSFSLLSIPWCHDDRTRSARRFHFYSHFAFLFPLYSPDKTFLGFTCQAENWLKAREFVRRSRSNKKLKSPSLLISFPLLRLRQLVISLAVTQTLAPWRQVGERERERERARTEWNGEWNLCGIGKRTFRIPMEWMGRHSSQLKSSRQCVTRLARNNRNRCRFVHVSLLTTRTLTVSCSRNVLSKRNRLAAPSSALSRALFARSAWSCIESCSRIIVIQNRITLRSFFRFVCAHHHIAAPRSTYTHAHTETTSSFPTESQRKKKKKRDARRWGDVVI